MTEPTPTGPFANAVTEIRAAMERSGQAGLPLDQVDLTRPEFKEISHDIEILIQRYSDLKKVQSGRPGEKAPEGDVLAWYDKANPLFDATEETRRYRDRLGDILLKGTRWNPRSDAETIRDTAHGVGTYYRGLKRYEEYRAAKDGEDGPEAQRRAEADDKKLSRLIDSVLQDQKETERFMAAASLYFSYKQPEVIGRVGAGVLTTGMLGRVKLGPIGMLLPTVAARGDALHAMQYVDKPEDLVRAIILGETTSDLSVLPSLMPPALQSDGLRLAPGGGSDFSTLFDIPVDQPAPPQFESLPRPAIDPTFLDFEELGWPLLEPPILGKPMVSLDVSELGDTSGEHPEPGDGTGRVLDTRMIGEPTADAPDVGKDISSISDTPDSATTEPRLSTQMAAGEIDRSATGGLAQQFAQTPPSNPAAPHALIVKDRKDMDQWFEMMAGVESSRGANKGKNAKSTAAGKYQIVRGTFLEYAKKYSSKKDSSLTDRDLLALRDDDGFSREVAELYMEHALIPALKQHGLDPTDAVSLYAAWHFGQGGGPKVAAADDDTPLKDVLGKRAMDSNPHLATKTVGQWKADARTQFTVNPVEALDRSPTGTPWSGPAPAKPSAPAGTPIPTTPSQRSSQTQSRPQYSFAPLEVIHRTESGHVIARQSLPVQPITDPLPWGVA